MTGCEIFHQLLRWEGRCKTQIWVEAVEVSGQEIHTFVLPTKPVNRAAGMITIFFWEILKFATCNFFSGIFLCFAEGQGGRMS